MHEVGPSTLPGMSTGEVETINRIVPGSSQADSCTESFQDVVGHPASNLLERTQLMHTPGIQTFEPVPTCGLLVCGHSKMNSTQQLTRQLHSTQLFALIKHSDTLTIPGFQSLKFEAVTYSQLSLLQRTCTNKPVVCSWYVVCTCVR